MGERRAAGSVERTNGGHYFADLPDGTCIGVYPSRAAAWAALSYYARTGERPGTHVKPQFVIGERSQGMGEVRRG